jgi:Bacterial type II and III secretion system protein/FG-GAP-like repeat
MIVGSPHSVRSSRSRPRSFWSRPNGRSLSWSILGVVAVLIASLGASVRSSGAPQDSVPDTATPAASKNGPKGDSKKAKDAYQRGAAAEKANDWEAAYTAYSDAVESASDNRQYFLHREIAKSHVVQVRVDTAERDAISGRLDDARRELLAASYIDPSDTVVRERLSELIAAEPDRLAATIASPDLSSVPRLAFQPGTKNFDYRGDTQGAYEELGRQFGVEVAFDVDLRARQVRFRATDVDFLTAARLLGSMTATFWRPLSPHLFFVTDNTPQKRRDYDASAVRTILLPASETPEEMTEVLRVVRDVTGITRSQLDTQSHTLTLRASPQAIAIATDLLDNLEQPTGELILEIEILEIDRTSALNLGITPPQNATAYTLTPAQVQEAQQSLAGLVDVITQVFGQPSSLSGLTSTQIASLLSSGQVNPATLLPPVIAFGGGKSTFLATLPGAAATFSQMLSTVRTGRRILLRAKDGQPATFFVGERFPVDLATFSPSLAGTGSNVSGVNAANISSINYAGGDAPSFLTAASLRDNSIDDLIVANNPTNLPQTVSVLLGDGTGVFAAPVSYPTGIDPVWIATGQFNANTTLPGAMTDEALDVAVVDNAPNAPLGAVSVLLGNPGTDGTGDGTLLPKTDYPVGNRPVSAVVANFHDLTTALNVDIAVANQGDNTISILQGNGDGTFLPAVTAITLPNGFVPTALAEADFNGDGHADLAVTSAGSNLVQIFLGKGDGTFTTGSNLQFATGNDPVYIATGDFNGDGILDLAVANNTDNTVSILFGNAGSTSTSIGNGTFTPGTPRDFPAGNGPTSIAVADFNVDGRPDMIVADKTDNAVSLLLNLGSGLFGPNLELPVDAAPVSVVAADFTGDTIPDAASANSGANDVTVVLNSSAFSGGLTNGGLSGTPFPGVEYLDIGVKVKATPRIHPNDEVTLQLDFDVSALTNQSFNNIPVISKQAIQQTVRLKENETANLAGFLQSELSNAINGTPGIADIPGVGLLGSTINPQTADTELLFLVTPRLVRLADHKDHTIYAGQGSPEGTASGAIGAVGATPPASVQGPVGGIPPTVGGSAPTPPSTGEPAVQAPVGGPPQPPAQTPPPGDQSPPSGQPPPNQQQPPPVQTTPPAPPPQQQ